MFRVERPHSTLGIAKTEVVTIFKKINGAILLKNHSREHLSYKLSAKCVRSFANQMITRIGLLAQPEPMRSKVGATQ
jgi:hypothetical protein